jgi:hypothetical protein
MIQILFDYSNGYAILTEILKDLRQVWRIPDEAICKHFQNRTSLFAKNSTSTTPS